jgi:hypothetical protein
MRKMYAVLYRWPASKNHPRPFAWTMLGRYGHHSAELRAGALAVLGFETIIEEVNQ